MTSQVCQPTSTNQTEDTLWWPNNAKSCGVLIFLSEPVVMYVPAGKPHGSGEKKAVAP